VSRRLLLLRHGRTAWNAEDRAQGHADIELDDAGHVQAAAVARHLARLGIDRVWSSDLTRARQTAGYVAEACGLTVGYDARLREFDVGERQGLTLDEFAERFPAEHAAWARGEGEPRVPAGEVSTEVAARIVPALHDCLAVLDDGRTGLVVAHGASLKVALAGLLGWPAHLAGSLRGMGNCCWATVETTVEGPGAGRVRLSGYNQNAPV